MFLHGLLPLECLGHKSWNFVIIIHMDCLVEGCQYCGWSIYNGEKENIYDGQTAKINIPEAAVKTC